MLPWSNHHIHPNPFPPLAASYYPRTLGVLSLSETPKCTIHYHSMGGGISSYSYPVTSRASFCYFLSFFLYLSFLMQISLPGMPISASSCCAIFIVHTRSCSFSPLFERARYSIHDRRSKGYNLIPLMPWILPG